MLETISAYIQQHQLLPSHGTVVVAVSGGADSLCLLHILCQLCGPSNPYPDLQLHVAHLDHQLRGEASQHDAAMVARLAQAWHLPYTLGSTDVYTLARREQRSLEDAARIARYRFLREIAHGQPIAVAHHMDDQFETLLLHWLRGGGIASMVGLQPRQQDIIRPLLCITRAETLTYCAQHNLIPQEDLTNTDTRFLRNQIRHELIPLLTSMNPGIRETILRNAEVMHIDLAWLEKQVDQCWPQVIASEQPQHIQLRVQPLLELPLSLQRHLMRRITARLCAGQSPLEVRHYLLLEDLLQRKSTIEAKTLHLPQQLRAQLTGNLLTFAHIDAHEDPPILTTSTANTETQLPIPGRVLLPRTPWTARAELIAPPLLQQVRSALSCADWHTVWKLLPATPNSIYVDADKLLPPGQDSHPTLYIRTRRAGDRIQPLGMTHTKKVQDILVDRHIPQSAREQIPLFFSADRCIWLAGVQPADQVRLTHSTQNIVHLEIIQTEQ